VPIVSWISSTECAKSLSTPVSAGSSSPKNGIGLPSAPSTSQPSSGITIMNRYSKPWPICARRCCQTVPSAAGDGAVQRSARRTNTSTNTLSPSMKCQVLSASRTSLPRGQYPRSSMQAYTATSSTSISQCIAIVGPL
jgi:hypothetical protein